jgi:RNA polymerase sigma-70 factor, ECF subfamily
MVDRPDPKAPFHAGTSPVLDPVMSQVEFDAVVTAHHEEILRYLRRVIGPAADAEDLSQETFLRAYRAYGSLSKDGDTNVRAWLFTIATNLAKNHFRSETRRRRAYGEAEAARYETTRAASEDELAARETGTLVERIVQGLPLKQRLAFTQRKLHDMDYEAIGKSLGCSAESARAHVFQALRKIRQGLGGSGFVRRGQLS